MLKSELAQRIASQNRHLLHHDVANIVNVVLGEITVALKRGERVELRGFGVFSVKHRPAHAGRNPKTGAHVAGIAFALGRPRSIHLALSPLPSPP